MGFSRPVRAGMRKGGADRTGGDRQQARESALAERTGGRVAVARVVRPWGRRGEVVAELLTDFPSRFELQGRVFLEGSDLPVTVERARLHQGRVVLKFSGTDSISGAERWRGRYVLIPPEERTPLPAHHYYRSELCQCLVVRETAQGEETVGTVEEVEPTGGVDLLRVRTREGEALIPLAQDICTRIDTAAKRIVIHPPDGLLETNR